MSAFDPDATLILVTRPPEEAALTAKSLAQAGWRALPVPMIATRPAPMTPALKAELDAAQRCPVWIFVSRAAVRAARHLLMSLPSAGIRHVAIGPATGRTLAEAGVVPDLVLAEGGDSEALLARGEFAQVGALRVAIFNAPGGRHEMRDQLRARGAEVLEVPVYRRVPLPISAASAARVRASLPILVMTATSVEIATRLAHWLQQEKLDAAWTRPLIVPSARVAAQARVLGFRDLRVADGAGDKALIRLLMSSAPGASSDPPRGKG